MRLRYLLIPIAVGLALFLPSPRASEKYPFRIDAERNARQVVFVAHNLGHAPISVAVFLQDLQNISSDRTWPVVAVVPPASTLLLGKLFPADSSRSWGYKYVSQSTIGTLDATHDPNTLYRLPYAEGAAFKIGQAPGGPITTHNDLETQNAIDFVMPEGTSVVAARAGVIIEAEGDYTEGGQDPSLEKKANAIRILHSDGSIGTYAHFRYKGIAVKNGQHVKAGEVIGYAGATGYASGPHLHFAVTRLFFRDTAFATISEPLTFYVGNPPVPFVAKHGMRITANYSSPAIAPRSAQVDSNPAMEFLAQWWWALALSATALWLLALLRKERSADSANNK